MKSKNKYRLPDNNVFRWHIFGLSICDFTLNAGRIQRRRYAQDNICRRKFVVETGFYGDSVGDLCSANLRDSGDDSQRQFDIGG